MPHSWSSARAELVEGEHRSGNLLVTCSIVSSLASLSGSADSFQVRVRWKEIPRACRSCRSRSRPIRTGRLAPVGGQLAQAPVRERLAQLFRAGGGRRDDALHVIVADQAGTAARPLRVQRRQPFLVEPAGPVGRVLRRLRWPMLVLWILAVAP
jgi:hypothetical protein